MDDDVLWWGGFLVFVAIMLFLDLGVFHRKAHTVTIKESLIWNGVWVTLALLFNVGIYIWQGPDKALEFLTGYLIEESLSIDNMFVFLLIFSYFGVPSLYQHKVLFWGIVGALVMRAIFIALGVLLIDKFHWIIYVFGAILMISGIRMAVEKRKQMDLGKNPLLRILRRVIPVSADFEEGRFFVRRDGAFMATPLFIVLLVVETTDLVFAIDSIPAILAITSDPFIVYTSNVFAILGLRALYFSLSGIMRLFRYLHYGLSFILVFVGVKMMLADVFKVPIWVALGVIAGTLGISVVISLLKPQKGDGAEVSMAPAKKNGDPEEDAE
jgi:tellurite resistance protein TerC